MNSFEGWYFKHQSGNKSLAVIPGRAADSAFVLIITNDNSYHVSYPLSEYHKTRHPFSLHVGKNIFTHNGVILNIRRPEITLNGEINYSGITAIKGDIMGPFKFFPMECRHGIISMRHSLNGDITLNGEQQHFSGGTGYIESDSGKSFPKGYTWVQCNDFSGDCSIMASVARIPFYGLQFWGCICVVWLNGREYRLATYKGVKILRCERGNIELKQGNYRLTVSIDECEGHKLPAPQSGKMSRLIRETLSCPAHFRFMDGDHCLFDGKSENASYEYMI
ncbi:MAG: hypothetical protein FWG87_08660 [Defluviitaleaceae bacterium]|nr:hypothetical protein [Defluviitaleaceae bacterium]